MKKFKYIPSFSIGALASDVKQGRKLGNIDGKFWDKDFPEKFRYPYFLLTAGHSYKQKNTREIFGLQDSFVMGDSGGFQIASGALKWNDDGQLRDQIFDWLENNSDVAMNLDIPPRMMYQGRFYEALEFSKNNYRYFADNQSGKTKYLNVIHGADFNSYNYWYQEIKDFDFSGWAIGGSAKSLFCYLCGLAVLVKNKEHLKNANEYLHILGASSPRHFFVMSQTQKSLADVGSNMTVTIDSSSPNIMSKFGTYTVSYDLKRLSTSIIHLEKKPTNYEEFKEYPLPITCDYDKWLNKHTNLYQMCQFSEGQYIGFVQHNLYMLLKMQDEIDYYVNGPQYILETVVSTDMYRFLKLIDEVIKSDTPDLVIERNKHFIHKFDSSTALALTKDNTVETSKFFN